LRAQHESRRKPLVVVKVSKPGQDMRFDVPWLVCHIEHMKSANATVGVEPAYLLFDRTKLIELADARELHSSVARAGWN